MAWSINGMEGARIKEGDERATTLRRRRHGHHGDRWRDFYKKAELAGTEDVGGKACYKLVLTPNEGSAETRYYDKSSNPLVKVLLPMSTPQGPTLLPSAGSGRLSGRRRHSVTPHSISRRRFPTLKSW